MGVDTNEQQRFAGKYASLMETRNALISLKTREATLEHLRTERYMDLPGYPSETGSLEMRMGAIEKKLHQFFTESVEDGDDERLKQEVDNLRHRLSMGDAEIAETLQRIENIRRATQTLEDHPELRKIDAELAPLIRQRDKLKMKLEAGKPKNPEAEFRRPFSASHYRLEE